MELNEWENWLRPEIQANVDLVKSYINKGDTFVDAGANTGLFMHNDWAKYGRR